MLYTVCHLLKRTTSLRRLQDRLLLSRSWTNTSRRPAEPNAWPASPALSARGPAWASEDSGAVVTSKLLRRLQTSGQRSSYLRKRPAEETRSGPTTAVPVGYEHH